MSANCKTQSMIPNSLSGTVATSTSRVEVAVELRLYLAAIGTAYADLVGLSVVAGLCFGFSRVASLGVGHGAPANMVKGCGRRPVGVRALERPSVALTVDRCPNSSST
jgi:hypothetical protein